MSTHKYYYNRTEAEELKKAFSSWINKIVRVGKGQLSILTDIKIRQKRSLFVQDPASKAYHVEFHFINSTSMDASHFLFINGLVNIIRNKSPLKIAFKKTGVEGTRQTGLRII